MRINELLQDEPVLEEMRAIVGEGRTLPGAEKWNVSGAMVERVLDESDSRNGQTTRPWTEAVIRDFGRPVLLIRNNKIELPRSVAMRTRVLGARRVLEPQLPSVGRIEFVGHPTHRWGGTGWVIAEGVVVTNRHVAEEFARRSGRSVRMRVNVLTGDAMQARIDFREELPQPREQPLSHEVEIRRVLFMEADDERKPDVAFLQLRRASDLPPPIPLSDNKPLDRGDIAVVGYPAYDSQGIPNEAVARRIFGDIYEVKRLAPGKVLVADADSWAFTHDATTLGGNSGSVVLDMDTGAAVGLHFLGQLGVQNVAVSVTALRNYLGRMKLGSQISVPASPAPAAPPATDPEVVRIAETKVADYADRQGYDPTFLGGRVRVELPTKKTKPRDVLMFNDDGRRSKELKYMHFSVAMSRKRKLCLWSAVNIDGSDRGSAIRTDWRYDPRIPKSAQTEGDVYGNLPRFSRGHMTRREDPIWGPTADADLGNDDSMHFTNAVPQMQPFNAGIWLGLENYALQNARRDRQRISVITGPVLSDDDPVRYGVPVPVEFWKVIAFVHDETRRLTATGYLMNQRKYLRSEEMVFGEFVFGNHETAQVPITTIETKTGLDFGTLRRRDPLRGRREAVAAELTDFNQIQFN
jgi:endonuclease G